MTEWLKRNDFSYKQPKGQPAKANLEEQKKFVEVYRTLQKEVVDEPILFIDSVHPTMASKISRGWIAKKADKFFPTTASRTRMNIAGAIELSKMKIITRDYETINAQSIISFLTDVRASYKEVAKIHIILDQSGYHKSHDLSKYAKNNGIELHFLPPYSPNLNPIERLWKVMNEEARNNYYFKSAKEFRERINKFFKEKIPIIAHTLSSRINDNFRLVTPAKSF